MSAGPATLRELLALERTAVVAGELCASGFGVFQDPTGAALAVMKPRPSENRNEKH